MANRDILEYLPDVIKDIREFKAIATAENPELTELWAIIGDAFSDQFIPDATISGVKRYESMLKIVPKCTDTLDERKFRILAKCNEKLPYTYRALKRRLDALCGANGYTFNVNGLTYTVTVKVELTAKSNFDVVDNMLEDMVPQDMIIDLSLRYNQYDTLSVFTYGYLSAYTYDELRNEVIA